MEIKFDDFTAIIGKNDAGKTTVLEALDIFFNEAQIDKNDINVENIHDNSEIVISVSFKDLPQSIVIDKNVSTTLQDEYLLNENGELEIIKKYPNAEKPKIYIRAMQPKNSICQNLLIKKQNDLQKILQDNQIDTNNIDLRQNSQMRKKIYEHFSNNSSLSVVEIELNKEDAKNIWEKLKTYMPTYFLFKSDRQNTDKDSEVQEPLKIAVKEFLENNENIKIQLNDIAEQVKKYVSQVSEKTLEKLQEIDKTIANTLHPQINVDGLKWQDVFKGISIAGDSDIPINKRGSGIKRLVLLSFFRAKVEQKIMEKQQTVIYAIEEPETSQHTNKQELLIETLKQLSQNQNTQVIITTHSSVVVRNLQFDNLRIVVDDETYKTGKSIENAKQGLLSYPSLNEINYLVFDDISEAYHDELYSELEIKGAFDDKNEDNFKKGKDTKKYKRECQSCKKGEKHKKQEEHVNGIRIDDLIKTEIIRHQIHHPENKLNDRFTQEELKNSIELMREFLLKNTVCNTKQQSF